MLANPPRPNVEAIIRVDTKTAKADTLAYFQAPRGISITVSPAPGRGAGLGPPIPRPRRSTLIDAFDAADDWVLTPDGVLAIVRVQDYHVDWVDPDGTRRSSPPVAWPWAPLSVADKQRITDSLQTVLDDIDRRAQQSRANHENVRPLIPTTDSLVVRTPLPDVAPPFALRQTRADFDQRLWVCEGASSIAGRSGAPRVYDIINRNGQIVDRVRLPVDATLAGFGPGGTVYLAMQSPRGVALERASFKPTG